MKIKYTLIKDIPSDTQIEVNDLYFYFNIEVVIMSDRENWFWTNIPNKTDILRHWFQLDVLGNRELRQALLHVPLNKTITFNMGDEFDRLDDQKFKECFDYMSKMKFEPNQKPTYLVKM